MIKVKCDFSSGHSCAGIIYQSVPIRSINISSYSTPPIGIREDPLSLLIPFQIRRLRNLLLLSFRRCGQLCLLLPALCSPHRNAFIPAADQYGSPQYGCQHFPTFSHAFLHLSDTYFVLHNIKQPVINHANHNLL